MRTATEHNKNRESLISGPCLFPPTGVACDHCGTELVSLRIVERGRLISRCPKCGNYAWLK